MIVTDEVVDVAAAHVHASVRQHDDAAGTSGVHGFDGFAGALRLGWHAKVTDVFALGVVAGAWYGPVSETTAVTAIGADKIWGTNIGPEIQWQPRKESNVRARASVALSFARLSPLGDFVGVRWSASLARYFGRGAVRLGFFARLDVDVFGRDDDRSAASMTTLIPSIGLTLTR